jgi:hypothetical protein
MGAYIFLIDTDRVFINTGKVTQAYNLPIIMHLQKKDRNYLTIEN